MRLKEIGVKFSKIGIQNTFTFAGQEFKYSAIIVFLTGLIVAIISASLGVGGGFLLVPFMTSVMGFPMYHCGRNIRSFHFGFIFNQYSKLYFDGQCLDFNFLPLN